MQTTNKPFKTKGMQLGAKGAKKQQELLDTLGGEALPEIEERAPLMVRAQHIRGMLHPDNVLCVCRTTSRKRQ